MTLSTVDVSSEHLGSTARCVYVCFHFCKGRKFAPPKTVVREDEIGGHAMSCKRRHKTARDRVREGIILFFNTPLSPFADHFSATTERKVSGKEKQI